MNTKAHVSIALALGCLAALAGEAWAGPEQLRGNEFLFRGQRLTAPFCFYRTEMQSDGNLVTRDSGGRPLWWSGTQGRGAFAVMQNDGNFVIHDFNDAPIWWTGTAGQFGASIFQQDDGNLVLGGLFGGVFWSSGVVGEVLGSTPCARPGVKTQVATNLDRPGGDFSSFTAARASHCGHFCANTGGCRSWVFFNGRCFLKGSVPAARPLTGATSGVIIR